MSQTRAQLLNPLNGNLNVTGVVTASSFVGNVTGNATGLSGTPNISAGVVTATSFSGSGSGLTGVTTNFVTAIGIQSAGNVIGAGITQLNFIGVGNTFAVNGSTVNISIAGGAGGGGVADLNITSSLFF